MAALQPRYSKEEFARRGDEIYESFKTWSQAEWSRSWAWTSTDLPPSTNHKPSVSDVPLI
jgi:hypothetical protein